MMSFAIRCVLLFCIGLLQAFAALEDNSVLALEPLQGMAVVKTATGELEVIRTGDRLPGSEAVVVQVLAEKLIAQEVIGDDPKVIQQVWIYKTEDADTGSRVERLSIDQPRNGALSIDSSVLQVQELEPDLLGASQ